MIRFFSRHPTAANLLMGLFLALGTLALPNLRRETLPEFAPSMVEVRVMYPGATAEEVDEALCRRIEDAVDGVNDLSVVTADAREGVATVTVEMAEGGDPQAFIADIEKAVDAIADFPPEVEDPVVTELGRTDPVLAVLVSGPVSAPDLKSYSEDLKARMKEAGLALVEIGGFSDRQFRVALSQAALRRFGLSVAQVSETIAARNTDLPVGTIETGERDLLLRFTGRRRTVEELEGIVVRAGEKGDRILLGDIARVFETFERAEDQITLGGRRAARLQVNKTKQQDTIRLAAVARAFLAEERLRQPQMEFVVTQDQSLEIQARLRMLVTNGWQGLLLVFGTLWLFFSLRVSFWVAMGLPASFFGAFFFMPTLGLTVNMMTMVGLLLALGLMMDDAIVIAENIDAHRQRGKGALAAAVDGTVEVAGGVVSSFLTTLCVLGPLAFISGEIGKILRVVPMILILVLAVSLVEAFLILPAHLGHALAAQREGKTNRLRRATEALIEWARERLVGRTVDVLLRWRYLFIGAVVALFVLSVGMIPAGKLKVQGFPDLEGNAVTARLLLPQGTPLARTEQTVGRIVAGLERVNAQFKPSQPGEVDLVRNVTVQYGVNVDAFESGPHVATVTVDLLPAEERSGRIEEYLAGWRRELGPLPDVLSLTFTEPGVRAGGKAIEIRIRGQDADRMKQAAQEVLAWFDQFEGVLNLADDLRPGKPELRLRLREGAEALGVDAAAVARQLRAGFQGLTAETLQLGPENYAIDVRTDAAGRDSVADLEHFEVVTADGRLVPLTALVEWEETRGFARLARHNGMRAVTVRGDVDTRFANANELIARFRAAAVPGLVQRYPNLQFAVAGESESSGGTQRSMLAALGIGLLGVFILLSFQFRSYVEPLIVMVAIPFSLIGVVWGHWLLGTPLSMPSFMGFIALAGVVVNDSILLVLFLKNAVGEGADSQAAAGRASRSRFRAVLLTSATTIAGLTPILFERSLQAQILKPLVISTVFGIAASTALVLLGIPCMYQILADLGWTEKRGEEHEEELAGAAAQVPPC